jgi:hypothetical protein
MRQNYYLMLKNILVSMCFIFVFQKSNAQQNVSISDLSTTPDASSVLDVSSTTKGLLIPRVALAATNTGTPITLPATSMLIYNTATAGLSPNNVIPGYYYNAGTPAAPNWLRVYAGSAAGTEWKLLGNSGTDANTNFLGTIDAVDLVFRTSNLQRARINSVGNMGIGVGPMGTAGQAILSLSRDGVNACCGGENSTLALGEATTTTGRRPSISFHASGESEGVVHITQEATGMGVIGVNRRLKFFDNQAQGLGLELTGNLWYGNGNSRTQWRDNAGLQGNAGAQSGFYETVTPSNYPATRGQSIGSWYHLLDVRHNNPANNYAMQFSGSFFDQDVFVRKTNDNPAQPWSRVVTTRDISFVKSEATGAQITKNAWVAVTGYSDWMNVNIGDKIKLDGMYYARLTGGSNDDFFLTQIEISGQSGCVALQYSNQHDYFHASESGADHDNFKPIVYMDVWNSNCNGQIRFRLMIRMNGDDNWEAREMIITGTRY